MASTRLTKQQLLEKIAELQRSEETWRSLVSHAPSFIAIVDRDGVMRFLNHTQPGHQWDAKAQHRMQDYIDPAYRDQAVACLESVFQTGRPTSYQTLAAGPHGTQAWYETHLGPVMRQGGIVAVALFSADITARKEAEAAACAARDTLEQQVQARTAELRAANERLALEIAARSASEERYRTLLESIHYMVWEVNGKGVFTYASPTALELLGFTDEELIGKSCFQFMTPEEQPRHRAIFEAQLAAGQGMRDIEIEMLCKDGRHVVHEANFAPVFAADGTCSGFRGVARDITYRKNMEASLQQSHQELQAIYDGMVDGLLIADLDSQKFLRANQAICRMLGYSEQELTSMSVRDIHPREELTQVLDRFSALAAGQVARVDNVPMLRKDGSLFYANITRNLLRYHGRDCVIGFFRDNTERKQAAEALNQEHQALRQLLKSQDRDRQIIAYEIHDGVAQLLAAAIMQFETYQDMRRDAPRVAEQSGTVVADLLRQCHAEVRRLISGLRPPVLDAFGVVAALQHLVYESVARWGVDIEFQPDVQFDRLDPALENAIHRIAQECLTNACQHSRSEKIQLQLTQQDQTVRIGVQDWGIGFDPQRTGEKCFGLAGIRQRARLLGGHVSITTQRGKGTHIVVDLPGQY